MTKYDVVGLAGDQYFERQMTESKASNTSANTRIDPAKEFNEQLAERATVYGKVTSRVVVKRYAVRKG